MGLLLTLILGIFIIFGAMIVFLFKNNEKFTLFSISLAFGVMTMLIIIDLLPEAYEVINSGNMLYNVIYILIGASIGFIFLKVLDHFIPDHDDGLDADNEDKNLKHIGLVSSVALVIHNIIEGMAIYLLVSSSLKAGLMACLGVGLHNIPLGMVIASTFYKSNNSRKNTLMIILSISLSTFIGGLLVYLFNLTSIMDILESITITLTIGMMLYIVLMELLPKIINSKDKKITISGILLGVILLVFTLFI